MARQQAAQIAAALGVLLQRRFRSSVYANLTTNVHRAVDPAAYPVLSGVARLGPISAATLGHEIGLDRSIVSRRAAALIGAGLLQAESDPADARATLLSLTDAGRTVVATLRRRLADVMDDHLRDWSDQDVAHFAALLSRFVEAGPLTADGPERQ